MDRFSSPAAVAGVLADAGYLVDEAACMTVFLASALSKPVLVEGPAGTGKTELAKAAARAVGAPLIRLQCYEGLDEAKALYEWDYKKQLLQIQSAGVETGIDDVFDERFLLTRPLLQAIRADEAVVLLIDEVDRVEVETEALLLEVLSDFQVSIPELGTLTARQVPLVFLTSNNTRELSEALKRRCLYLHIDYPPVDRELEIIRMHVPEIDVRLAELVTQTVAILRGLDLQKHPSISETIDWARTLVLMQIESLDEERVVKDLPILLKYRSDIEKATAQLRHTG